ncbi:MAG: uroporphyrinogen-III C-methyltransferase [Cyclobacteriaceae bacterium]|nr:uroporphyrinogen-III C-methyltransferase [Cyclobacteriaceae bacterium]
MIRSIFSTHQEPKLSLVGAGPGDPELMTLKAINALQSANIVLYDALVSEAILKYIPTGVPAFSVGKRAGEHSFTQDKINELIVEFAFRYGHVVRLKGGDPFVFGRAMEEIEIAAANGIQTIVVPGITSALAVPASLGIPVTARGVSESFWVITGTTKEGLVSEDVALAARSTATVVILMGVNKLEEMMGHFEAAGKANTPVAVIQNGTLSNERSVIGDVSSIANQCKNEGIGSPAVIVIGEVVKYAHAGELLQAVYLPSHHKLIKGHGA